MREVNGETLIDAIEYIEQKKAIFGELAMSTEFSLAAYKMLLATMEAEPVAWIVEGEGFPTHITSKREYAYSYDDRQVTPLYRHAEQPVVSDEGNKWSHGLIHPENCQCIECRSAMPNQK